MATSYSTASSYINQIDESYPVANKDNSSQGFRDNFRNIKTSLNFIDTDTFNLTDNIVSVNNEVTDFKDNTIKKFVLDGAGYVVYDKTSTLETGDITVNIENGSFQKFSVSSGTHWFSFINWPKNSHASKIILSVSTTTNDETKVNFDFDISGEGVIVSNYGRNEFPLTLTGDGPFLFEISNDGSNDIVCIKEYKDSNVFTKPMVLPSYTKSSLKKLTTATNGLFAFLTQGFNTPVYSYNGKWYSMFNNQAVSLYETEPVGPQGPTGGIDEEIIINILNPATTINSGENLLLEFEYSADTSTTITRTLSWSILGPGGFTSSGSKNIILQDGAIVTATQLLSNVGDYIINVSLVGQNGITINDSRDDIKVSALIPFTYDPTAFSFSAASVPSDLLLGETYLGGVLTPAGPYIGIIGSSGEEEVDTVSVVSGVVPPGMSVVKDAGTSGKFNSIRLLGTPTTLGLYFFETDVTFVGTEYFADNLPKEIRVGPNPISNAILPCSQDRTVNSNQGYTQLGNADWQGPLFAYGYNQIELSDIVLVSGTIPPGMYLSRQILINDFGQPYHYAGLTGTPTTPGVYTVVADISSPSVTTIQVTKIITVV